jgi:hypothetical protein
MAGLTVKKIFLGVFVASILLSLSCSVTFANDRSVARALLDQRTAFRWGDDNLAWVVHYPDAFVDLWVKSEAEKQRMKPDQEEAYRKSFTEELRTGAATTILLSIHAFGQSPFNITPLSKNIALVDSSGRRVNPIAFEKKLDGPLNGLMQGLVFFPRQKDDNFSIIIKGLIREGESIFSFTGSTSAVNITTASPAGNLTPPQPLDPKVKETVVKIPVTKPSPPKPPQPPEPPKQSQEEESSASGEIFPPTTPQPPRPPAIQTPDGSGLPEETPEPKRAPKTGGLSQKQALDMYLRAWIDGDVDKMYSLLSDESKSKVSKELFARDTMSDSFRKGLRAGYKTDWSGDSARVIVSKKILFMRTLESKQINFVEEDGSARVSW